MRHAEDEHARRRHHEHLELELEIARGDDEADGPGESEQGKDQPHPVRQPGHPAGEEMVALGAVEITFGAMLAVEHAAEPEGQEALPVPLEDLHRAIGPAEALLRSEEHTSELQSLM